MDDDDAAVAAAVTGTDHQEGENAMAGLIDSNAVDFIGECNNPGPKANNGKIIADAKQTEFHNADTMDDDNTDATFHDAADDDVSNNHDMNNNANNDDVMAAGTGQKL
mmetsp:Transcript_6344/g.13575  ORF Transcript_6344/g.13575 Transcript_6344/m.13575 type:complete len:108 (-) Transcript_6344:93-416(-)